MQLKMMMKGQNYKINRIAKIIANKQHKLDRSLRSLYGTLLTTDNQKREHATFPAQACRKQKTSS